MPPKRKAAGTEGLASFRLFLRLSRSSSEPRAFGGVCVEAQKVRGPTREGVCRSVPRFWATSSSLAGMFALWQRVAKPAGGVQVSAIYPVYRGPRPASFDALVHVANHM